MTIADNIIVVAFGSAFTTLSGVVGVLWRKQERESLLQRQRHEACETANQMMADELAAMRTDSRLLHLCPNAHCPLRPPVSPPPDHLNHPVPLHP